MVRLTDRHKMTYSKNTKIHILIIHTKEKYQSDVRFFSEQLRVFRGAGPPDCPNGAFVYRKILNTYLDIYLFVSLFFFSYTHVRTCSFAGTHMRMCFCFVLLSLALFYLSRVISCLLLRVLTYLAIIVTIFTFFSKHTHVRICTHADAHMRECIFFLPSTYSTYIGLCCFYFPAFYTHASAYLHSCRYAYAYVSLYLGEFRI